MTTARDRIWSITLRLARERYDRGWLREFTPETVATVATDQGVETSERTVRRVLDAMSDLDILEDISADGDRRYIWSGEDDVDPSTDMSQSRRRTSDTSVAGPSGAFEDEDRLIYHLFADTGVESEPLSAFGAVVRVGLDPRETLFSSALKADATTPPLRPDADLVVVHPYCQRWSTATRISGTQGDHPDQLDEARAVARELGDHYILENVPEAPLENPVELRGDMFGLPVAYSRAFETSFDVPELPSQPTIDGYREPFETDEGRLGMFLGEVDYWRCVKQVSGEYPAKELKHSGIPAPYIFYLCYWWLREIEGDSIEERSDQDTDVVTEEGSA